MKKIVQMFFLSVMILGAVQANAKFTSALDIEGAWAGQEDIYNCVFPILLKFVAYGNIVTGIEHTVSSWTSECEPMDFSDSAMGEGFLRPDSETIIFPAEGAMSEYLLSADGKTLTRKIYYSGKLHSTATLERE